jgi:hypothetical protein
MNRNMEEGIHNGKSVFGFRAVNNDNVLLMVPKDTEWDVYVKGKDDVEYSLVRHLNPHELYGMLLDDEYQPKCEVSWIYRHSLAMIQNKHNEKNRAV